MTLALIIAAAVSAIEGLDASAFAQPTGGSARWAQSAQVLDPMMMPAQAGHLAFSFLVRSRPSANMERDEVSDVIRVRTNVEIAFCYRLRADNQVADYASAWGAAAQLCACLNDEVTWTDGGDTDGDVLVVITDLGTPRLTLAGGLLLITVGASILHSEEL